MSLFNKTKVWDRQYNDFAQRFDESDLRGIFSKKVTIEQGTKALILQGGVYCGLLPAGVYTIGDFATHLGLSLERRTTIILVDAGEVKISFEIDETDGNLITEDNIPVSVSGHVLVQIKDASLFLENYLKHRQSISLSEISAEIQSEISVCLKSLVSQCKIADLVSNASLQNLAKTHIKEEISKDMSRKGIEICSIGMIDFNSRTWGPVREAKGAGKIAAELAKTTAGTNIIVRDAEAADILDGIQTAGTLERATQEEEQKTKMQKIEHDQKCKLKELEGKFSAIKSMMVLDHMDDMMELENLERYLIANRENERIVLENRSNASIPALLSILDADNPNSIEIAKNELARRSVSLSPEQILSVQAGYSDAAANAMKEYYASQKTQEPAPSEIPDSKRYGNQERYIRCQNCGEFNVETARYCNHCRQRLN